MQATPLVNLYPKTDADRLVDMQREITCMRATLMASAERHKQTLPYLRETVTAIGNQINRTTDAEKKKRLIRAEAAAIRHIRRTRTIIDELGQLAARAEGYQS